MYAGALFSLSKSASGKCKHNALHLLEFCGSHQYTGATMSDSGESVQMIARAL